VTKDPLDYIVACALAEDLTGDYNSVLHALIEERNPPFEDITSSSIFSDEQTEAYIIARNDGVLSGTRVVRRVFKMVDTGIEIDFTIEDGKEFLRDDVVAHIGGKVRSILMGERTALNFLGHLSGIAAMTRKFVHTLEETGIKVLDTRKTLPGLRMLEKEAVLHGGGKNHRMGLYDMVLIKDNHVDAAGSIKEAVNRVRSRFDGRYTIEVETRNLQEVKEALDQDVDRIMLDNMTKSMIQDALQLIRGRVEVEVSGNITLERINELKDLDIDYISTGSITYAAGHTDFSLLLNR